MNNLLHGGIMATTAITKLATTRLHRLNHLPPVYILAAGRQTRQHNYDLHDV